MHQGAVSDTKSNDSLTFQFPLLGIFPCISNHHDYILAKDFDFQFPLLGIFPCILIYSKTGFTCESSLSIPSTWDFSMHLPAEPTCSTEANHSFQFPLLGIFPCISPDAKKSLKYTVILSIPSTWDFSMHPIVNFTVEGARLFPFNSLYLGFFHASFLFEELMY